MPERKMSFLEHLSELRDRLIKGGIPLVVLFAFFIAFGIDFVQFRGWSVPIVKPTLESSIAVNFFKAIESSILPQNVEMIMTSPTDAMMVSVLSSFFLALVFAMPILVYQLGKFLAPALHPHEKKIILRMTIPSSILFVAGTIFAFFFVLPLWLNILYMWAGGVGAAETVRVKDLFSFVIRILIAFGIIFELPVIQIGITKMGVVTPDFWKDNWRWATIIIVFLSALASPADVFTLGMMATPMLVLYFLGYYFSKMIVE